ncbi:MAG: EAL domain-containing protein [Hydrogenophaga sp.]|nr:EAL domain-containing protein [Hydrogenophaga sp.]
MTDRPTRDWSPMRWLARSIKRQLLSAIVLVLVVLIAGFTTDVLMRQKKHLAQQQQTLATDLAHTLAVSAASWVLARDMVGLTELIDAQRVQEDLVFAMLLDRHGRVLAHSDPQRIGQDVLDLPTPPAERLYANEAALVDAVAPALIGKVHVGWARVGLSQHAAQQQMRQLLWDALRYGVLAVLAGGVLALLAVRRMTRHLQDIQRVAERVEGGDDSARVPNPGEDEIGRLGQYFNRMLERLQVRSQELTDSESYNKSLFAESRVAMVVMDPISLRFIDCNAAAQQIYGLPSRSVLLGLTPKDVSAERQYDGTPSDVAALSQIRLALAQGERMFDWRHRRPDGELWDAEVRLMSVQTRRGRFLQITLEDITRRRQAEHDIHRLAYYDTLTQLPNRRLMLDRLRAAIANASPGRPAALLLLDIDHFKAVNDTQGHAAGDRLLLEVTRRLQQLFPNPTALARLGGDEFGVIVEAVADDTPQTTDAIELMATTLLKRLSEPYDVAQERGLVAPHYCTASLGIVVFQGQGFSADEVLQHADTALHKAKASGRNSFRFFDPDMQAAVLARVALEAELRQAVEREELALYLQPQVNAQHEVVGGEVLLRWLHPTRGVVSPMDFIPLAEETGLIIPIGRWVLEQACRHLVDWARDPVTAHWSLSVNVSARQMGQPDFQQQLQGILERSGANAQRLKIEITESVMMEHAESTLSTMWRLKGMGLTFSMDDFGTGYSSLSYLKRLPLDQLKIDRSFVRDIQSDANDTAIARTVVALGQSLGMVVVAEGVETQAQLTVLQQLGCHLYQGYLFGRPFPMAELAAWQAAHEKRRALGAATVTEPMKNQ